jgi:hypothetical protein
MGLMSATDALLAHTDFAGAFTDVGRAHLARMAETFVEDAGSGSEIGRPEAVLSRWESATRVAETFYVDPLMRDVVTAAAASMPGEPLLAEDMPTSHGFVLIPGGVGQVNVYGRLLVINAVLWATRGGRVELLMLTDKYDSNDYYNAEAARPGADPIAADLPRWMPSSLLGVGLGEPLPVMQTFASTLPPNIHTEQREDGPGGAPRIHLLRVDGSPAREEDVPDLDFGMHPEPVTRWLVAMWRLMQQSLATVEREGPSRQVRRQLARRNNEVRTVSVIALRRKASPAVEGSREVVWSHRWIRRGHWRQQPCKENGDWVTRVIWIHPTICGPEDKPLLVRDRVYSLRR